MIDGLDPSLPRGRATRGEVLAWAMYDWANSAYSTLSITILVTYIQRVVFPPETYGEELGAVVWAWGISLSMLVAAILSPVVGAMADAQANKRGWLAGTALSGAGCAVVLAAVPPEYPWIIVAMFLATGLLFELSLGFYNGFLPEIADERSLNRISAWGYGLGYIGGALALVLCMLVMKFGATWGISDRVVQLRIGLAILGLWWGLFSLPAIFLLRDRQKPRREATALVPAIRTAVKEVGHTLANIRAFGALALFLLGFLFYNDGIQTVISQASTFALRELRFSDEGLIGLILMVQCLAMPGAIAVGWLADRLGQKPTLMICLAIWCVLLVAAYFVTTQGQFWILGAVLALVMGGTQSVSRAMMGMMTPRRHTAEFFGFFNLSGKATSFLGTFTFGLMITLTESARYAIVSLLVFFILGWALASRVDVERGRREARAAD